QNGGLDVAQMNRIDYAPNQGQVCCVTGATTFAGKIFASFTSRLVSMDMGSDGGLTNAHQYNDVQAVNVTSTPQFLYVQHRANYSYTAGLNRPTGIYVFNTQGQNVAFLKLDPKK